MYPKNTVLKNIGASLIAVLLIGTALYTPPLQSRAEPTLLSVLIGGVASLLGIDFFSCGFNILFYCDNGGGVIGADGGDTVVQDPCTSSANACGQTNTGFFSADHATCSATPPDNSTCPTPTIGSQNFYANPAIIGVGMSTTLHWSSSNATECDITSQNGFSALGLASSGSISTGSVSATSIYTVRCNNGNGGPSASASVRVVVDPQFKEI